MTQAQSLQSPYFLLPSFTMVRLRSLSIMGQRNILTRTWDQRRQYCLRRNKIVVRPGCSAGHRLFSRISLPLLSLYPRYFPLAFELRDQGTRWPPKKFERPQADQPLNVISYSGRRPTALEQPTLQFRIATDCSYHPALALKLGLSHTPRHSLGSRLVS